MPQSRESESVGMCMSAQHETLCAVRVCQPVVSSQASAKVPLDGASARGVFDGASARGALDGDWSDDWLDEVISQMPDDISFANIHLV